MSTAEVAARQLEAAFSKVKSPVDVEVLVDGSSSVSDYGFEIMRLCIRQAVEMFPSQDPEGVRFGIIQFDSTIKIECPLKSNMQDVKCSISAMQQLRGGTNAKKAFENARIQFKGFPRPAARCIVFLTDGDCADAVQVGCEMRDKENTHIIAIGVGLSDSTNLAKIASNNSYFLFNSFETLRDVFTYLNRTAGSPPEVTLTVRGSHSVTLQVIPPPEVLKFAEWEVEMFDADNKWKRLGNSQGEVLSLYSLTENKQYTLRGRMLFTNNIWSDYSADFKFRTMIENPLAPVIRDPRLRKEECKQLVEKISKLKPNARLREANVTKYNLLFLGRMGAGKSSLLDSMASAINGEYTVLAPFRASLETVTQKFTMYPLVRGKSRAPQICIGDVYGWSESNYKNSEVGMILDGNVKSGYTETVSGFLPAKTNPHYRKDPSFNDKIHAVIVVVSAATIGSETEMGRLKEFYKSLTDRGYQPVFVLTKVDRLPDPVLIGKTENVLDSGIVDAVLNNFSQESEIPRASVLPIINYQGAYTKEPDYVVELLALTTLLTALQTAKNFLELHEEEIVEEAQEIEKKAKGSAKKKSKAKVSDDEDEEEEAKEDSENERENVSDEEEDTKKSKNKKVEKKSTPKASPIKSTPPSSPSIAPVSPSAIMNLIEAAAYLNVEDNELLDLLESKEIAGKKIGANWRITKDAIDKYLNA